jgi:hypothetical protein
MKQQLVSDYLERRKEDELLLLDSVQALRVFNIIINNKRVPMAEVVKTWKETQHNDTLMIEEVKE